ncbi:DUF192 domain-containing protein [Coralloluteibacterium stylophorae]|uniref:DUF192 domain-containing protein n=2 Tax=Coralloluteibacterium stylophorae TaxID=1776034 RepID=A0A8J8AYF6_9GAMM|nr:DUF192 domain-containing protein [Coralloluteibacterium stylophorae]MBS7458554.1 DUF192 domain-containing protein [Coralloluteibacterium stylophorae]
MSLLTVCACLASSGCASEPWVELHDQRFTVEVANDDAARAQGLMFRHDMAPGHGMLFIHEQEEPQAYWMKNTRIPLDILYFDDERRLVSAQLGVPACSLGNACPPYPSEGPARYVLELNAGVARDLGVKPGDELLFGPGLGPDTPTRVTE